jgi:hypothetical protein
MAVDILLVINAKTTSIVLYKASVLSSDTHPFCLLARHGIEKFYSFFRCIRVSTCDVSDLFATR